MSKSVHHGKSSTSSSGSSEEGGRVKSGGEGIIVFGVGENNYKILKEPKSTTHLLFNPSDYLNYKIISVSCGGDFLFLLIQNKTTLQNRLLSAGYNGTGEQGVPIIGESSCELRDITDDIYKLIDKNNIQILQAQCGWNHSMILVEYDDDDKNRIFSLYGTGFNSGGQLSINNATSTNTFTKAITDHIPLHQIERLISRFNTCAIITKDGKLYASGNNSNSELGKANETIHKFELIFENVKDADFSYSHSVIIDKLGNIYSAGRNDNGKLGRLDTDIDKFIKLDFPEKAIKVSLGIHHTMILTENGNVYGCGYNDNGELGIDSTQSSNVLKLVQSTFKFKDISCGFYYSSFLTRSNQVLIAGSKWRINGSNRNIPQSLYCEDSLYSQVNSIYAGGYFLISFKKEDSNTKQLQEMFTKLKNLISNHAFSDIDIIH